MDDNKYVSESDRRPHLSLERHLTVGPNVYQLTAAGTGDDRIGLTLVGWNATGEVVSEISGGISPTDLTPVADALTSTLAGLATLRRQRLTAATPVPQPTPPAERPKRHRNQGVRWSTEDDARLATRHQEGATTKDLMEEFGRSRPGITARLEHLGLIEPASPVTPPGSGPAIPGKSPAGGARESSVRPPVWNARARSVVHAPPDAPVGPESLGEPVPPTLPATPDAVVVPKVSEADPTLDVLPEPAGPGQSAGTALEEGASQGVR